MEVPFSHAGYLPRPVWGPTRSGHLFQWVPSSGRHV
jgi:hypothetical protein